MKVHVVCHGLFGIVEPRGKDFVEAVFLDAAGWPDPDQIPEHELFIRYTTGEPAKLPQLQLSKFAEISFPEMPSTGLKIESKPLELSSLLDRPPALKSGCSMGEGAACKLFEKPLIRTRLKLAGGTLRNCEFDLVNGIDLRQQRNTWGSQHVDFEWIRVDKVVKVSKTFNAVLFSFDVPGTETDLTVNGESLRIGLAASSLVQRLGVLGEDFALVTFNNTVPKSAHGHFHVDPNRDLHSLLFHEMFEKPLDVDQRPVPRARLRSGFSLEAPPLNRCIPYCYSG